ncbi:N-glycosyltransferase [Thalassoglobus neptunius]|uniref:N-glycosyltransferase n=1 Tax=Thalassoglobus neptunius TaxID=1938619 RepID=A0A5C5WBH0_9PLAN|nr:TIGR04283 family arsenosugar biosynthesis glycosyltransferase [Thalassoglobus neptunius]TWT47974.1 N-glycosyltransferase [Thalassoglobus neptunius]
MTHDTFSASMSKENFTSQIAVIIPTLNEENSIAGLISRLRQLGDFEIIVVDGGSSDETIAQSRNADKVLESPPGRARQQNLGAQHANAEYLLFLHADCDVSAGFDQAVADILRQPDVSAGCFSQRIDHPAKKYRLIESGNAWRVRVLGWIYGDQGLFVRRETFLKLGGFPEIELMEDLFFSKQLRREGRLVIANAPLTVSARRWEKRGVLVQTLSNWFMIVMVHLGVSPKRLAKWYGHVREEETDADSVN